jgi:hypothetical protein
MANLETQSLTQTGMVEVSGWDEDEVFFVERSELAWDECAGRLNSSSTRNRGGPRRPRFCRVHTVFDSTLLHTLRVPDRCPAWLRA